MGQDTRYTALSDFYPANMLPRLKAEDVWLGGRVAQTHEGHWCVKTNEGGWNNFRSQAAAERAVIQRWGGPASGIHAVSDKDIAEFMDEKAPVVRGFMAVPNCDKPAIRFRGDVFINSWDEYSMVAPNEQAMNDPTLYAPLTILMRMLRENLCGKEDSLSLPGMLAAASSDDPNELEWRFLMSWLAKPRQSIGYNMQTNLWLLGQMTGIGKGVLTSVILPRIYGASNVCEVNAAEIEKGGWTDILANKLIVIINELRPSRRFDWNTFIKQNSTEATVQIRKRNCDSFTAINFANWIFTTNDESPSCLDSKDRRNALVCTTVIEGKRQVALDLWRWIQNTQQNCPQDFDRLLGAFVYLLTKHPVDEALIAFAPDTLIKRDVQEATSDDMAGLYWLKNDDDYPRDQWQRAKFYLEFYNRTVRERDRVDGRGMGAILAKLARHKFIERDKPYPTSPAVWRISSTKFPTAVDQARQNDTKKTADILPLVPRR